MPSIEELLSRDDLGGGELGSPWRETEERGEGSLACGAHGPRVGDGVEEGEDLMRLNLLEERHSHAA